MNALLRHRFELPPARILTCTEEEYFADPCEIPSLSQSVAHTLVSESPRHGWLQHPKLGGHRGDPTTATDEGHVLHKILLGKGADIAIMRFNDFRSKASQEERDAALAAGKIPMLEYKLDQIALAAYQLQKTCTAMGYEFTGESEVPIEWYARGAHGPVLCRSRLDHLILSDGRIFDVKKTRNANPDYLRRNLHTLGYDIQATAYTRAVEALRPDLQGRIDMTFLFMELTPPYSVVPADLSGVFREIGAMRWERAVQLWERCLSRDEWPSYCSSRITLDAPTYIIQQELGNSPDL